MLLEVSDQSHVAAARRTASALAQTEGLDESATGRIALIATEIATNLLKHGRGGHISLDRYADGSGAGVELIGLDSGDGIADIPRALSDGYSTAGTSGNGLGIINRQSDTLTLFSRPNMGTVLVARVAGHEIPTPGKPLLGAVVAPYPGETVCGDSWAYADTPAGQTLMMADGSGHGPVARKAAETAVEIFRKNAGEPCPRILELIHRALFSTRGAAIAVARIDTHAGLVRFGGIGNIVGAMITGPEVKRMVSHNGTAGMLNPRISEFTYPFTSPPVVFLHSDGLTAKWNLGDYPGLLTAHPSIIAGLMFRDFRRGRDDASVVAMRSAA